MRKSKQKVVRYEELTALKGLIRERKSSYKVVAAEVNIATNTFNNKINGYGEFSSTEISDIADFLDIPPELATHYFFPRWLRNATKSRT